MKNNHLPSQTQAKHRHKSTLDQEVCSSSAQCLLFVLVIGFGGLRSSWLPPPFSQEVSFFLLSFMPSDRQKTFIFGMQVKSSERSRQRGSGGGGDCGQTSAGSDSLPLQHEAAFNGFGDVFFSHSVHVYGGKQTHTRTSI